MAPCRFDPTILALLAVGPVFAAAATSGQVSGRVADERGRAVAGASLTLSNPVSGYEIRRQTNGTGQWQVIATVSATPTVEALNSTSPGCHRGRCRLTETPRRRLWGAFGLRCKYLERGKYRLHRRPQRRQCS